MGTRSLGEQNANCPPMVGPTVFAATGRKLDLGGFTEGLGREKGLLSATSILVTSATGFDRDADMTGDEVDVYQQRGKS